jgi:hypothetical protein
MEIRDRIVDSLKRRAIPLLHRTARGEALLMRIYLAGEEQSELPFLSRDAASLPALLRAAAARHRADELRHAGMFRARIEALTGAPAVAMSLGWVSRWKLRRFHSLAERGQAELGHPWAGPYAVAWREEKMAARVLERHVRTLERKQPESPSLPLLRRVLGDERAHVAMCERALNALVPADRQPTLDHYVRRIDRVDRAFGVAGALGLLLIGGLLWASDRVGSSIWPWRTRAAT